MAGNGELGEIQLETPDQRAVRIWGGYAGYKAELDHVVRGTAESMVRIGYMLKEARDSSILDGSGYSDVWEFAEAEYGIGKSQASRFMAAADRYGDAAGRIKGEWSGRSKMELIELLSIPEDKAKEIPQGLPREDLRKAVKTVKRLDKLVKELQSGADQDIDMVPEAQEEMQEEEPAPTAEPDPQIEAADLGEEAQPDADPEPEETETDPRNTAIAEGSYLDMMKASGHIMVEVMDENVDWSTAWNDVRDFQVKVEKFVDSLTALQCRDLRARSDKKERSKSTDENCNRNM